MTPIRHPRTAGEARFNAAHRKTRVVIEQTFGLLKMRFLCLSQPGGQLLYDPVMVSKIFICCCMLHNLCLKHNITDVRQTDIEPEIPNTYTQRTTLHQNGQRVRNQIIQGYFEVSCMPDLHKNMFYFILLLMLINGTLRLIY